MSNKEKFYGINESNWGHKWGYKDSGFKINSDKSVTFTGKRYPICGKRLYNFIPFVEEILGVEFALEPKIKEVEEKHVSCLLYTSPSPRDISGSRMPSSA